MFNLVLSEQEQEVRNKHSRRAMEIVYFALRIGILMRAAREKHWREICNLNRDASGRSKDAATFQRTANRGNANNTRLERSAWTIVTRCVDSLSLSVTSPSRDGGSLVFSSRSRHVRVCQCACVLPTLCVPLARGSLIVGSTWNRSTISLY